jgi:hypothetical protein
MVVYSPAVCFLVLLILFAVAYGKPGDGTWAGIDVGNAKVWGISFPLSAFMVGAELLLLVFIPARFVEFGAFRPLFANLVAAIVTTALGSYGAISILLIAAAFAVSY